MDLSQQAIAAKTRLKSTPSGDSSQNQVHSHLQACHWECGRSTRNHSGICDSCWKNREVIANLRRAKDAQREQDPRRVASGKRLARIKSGMPFLEQEK